MSSNKAYAQYQQDIVKIDQNCRSSASNYGSIPDTVLVKDGYNRSDYNHFRNIDFLNNRKSVLETCQRVYDKVGIVKNVIDLMSDFGSKGIRVKHVVPSSQRLYEKWWGIVNGTERSERFLNSLFRLGSVVTYKSYGVLPKSKEIDYKKTVAAIELDGEIDLTKFRDRYIPIRYTFINPVSVEALGENMGISLGKNIYVLKLNENFLMPLNNYLINQAKTKNVLNKITEGLPKSLREAILKKSPYYELDMDRVSVYNYRKDDWTSWGKPITYSILDDLYILEKLKLADVSALDGAISNVRLWTIGQIDGPQNTFIPTPEMLNKARDTLASNVGGGTMDLVWGPDLSFKESSTNVHEFLGEQKYKPTIDAIYDGLGVPSPLRSGSSSGQTNDYISLKTLIERLNYGRNMLLDFWTKEIIQVQKACGLAKPGVLEFDHMVFTDEAAEKQLLINLADRGIITDDTLREKMNFNSKIEESKIQRETKKRGKKIPNKAGPFHTSQTDHEYNKILLTAGTVTPSQVGLDLPEKKPGEETRQDMLFKQQKEIKSNERKDEEIPGRPLNIKETTKRNPKTGQDIKISKSQDMFFWASSSQDFIHKQLVQGLDKIFGKKNLRQLTEEEAESFEMLKCNLLFMFSPFEEVTLAKIHEKLQNYYNLGIYDDAKFMINETKASLNREMSMEEKRQVYAFLYTSKH